MQNQDINDAIKTGLCECGCGQKTRLARQTSAEKGWVKGNPTRFVNGHNQRRQSLEKDFWAKVDKNGPIPEHRPDLGPCWIWTGCNRRKSKKDYGLFSVDQKPIGAYRVAYVLMKGPIPKGLEPDHLCRVRACVNPEHLEAVSPTENKLRGTSPSALNARKTHCPQGHPYAGDNLTVRRGSRECRICSRESRKREYLAHRDVYLARSKAAYKRKKDSQC